MWAALLSAAYFALPLAWPMQHEGDAASPRDRVPLENHLVAEFDQVCRSVRKYQAIFAPAPQVIERLFRQDGFNCICANRQHSAVDRGPWANHALTRFRRSSNEWVIGWQRARADGAMYDRAKVRGLRGADVFPDRPELPCHRILGGRIDYAVVLHRTKHDRSALCDDQTAFGSICSSAGFSNGLPSVARLLPRDLQGVPERIAGDTRSHIRGVCGAACLVSRPRCDQNCEQRSASLGPPRPIRLACNCYGFFRLVREAPHFAIKGVFMLLGASAVGLVVCGFLVLGGGWRGGRCWLGVGLLLTGIGLYASIPLADQQMRNCHAMSSCEGKQDARDYSSCNRNV